jgi:F0F1-type ATP synthase beta subunit
MIMRVINILHLIVVVQVPVGRATLGRIINVIGEAIDERGDISK